MTYGILAKPHLAFFGSRCGADTVYGRPPARLPSENGLSISTRQRVQGAERTVVRPGQSPIMAMLFSLLTGAGTDLPVSGIDERFAILVDPACAKPMKSAVEQPTSLHLA